MECLREGRSLCEGGKEPQGGREGGRRNRWKEMERWLRRRVGGCVGSWVDGRGLNGQEDEKVGEGGPGGNEVERKNKDGEENGGKRGREK